MTGHAWNRGRLGALDELPIAPRRLTRWAYVAAGLGWAGTRNDPKRPEAGVKVAGSTPSMTAGVGDEVPWLGD